MALSDSGSQGVDLADGADRCGSTSGLIVGAVGRAVVTQPTNPELVRLRRRYLYLTQDEEGRLEEYAAELAAGVKDAIGRIEKDERKRKQETQDALAKAAQKAGIKLRKTIEENKANAVQRNTGQKSYAHLL